MSGQSSSRYGYPLRSDRGGQQFSDWYGHEIEPGQIYEHPSQGGPASGVRGDGGRINAKPPGMNGHDNFNPRKGISLDSAQGGRQLDQPDEKKDRSQGLRHVLSKFADRTSLNGIPFIKASKNPVVRGIWTILLLLAIGAMTYHLYRLFSTFFEYKKQTQVTLTFSHLQFPAITICNLNAMRYSQRFRASDELNDLIVAVNPEEILEKAKAWKPEYEYEDEDGKRKKRSTHNNEKGQFRKTNFLDEVSLVDNITRTRASTDNMYQEFGDNWEAQSEDSGFYNVETVFRELFMSENETTRADMGHQIRDFLVQCSFAGGTCFQKNFTRVFSTKYGNCYTIQYSKFISRKSGPANGLEVILYLETDEYVPGITNGKGVHLVVHEQGTIPFPEDEGIAIAAGTNTLIAVKLVEISRLGEPFGKCMSVEEFQKQHGIAYTRNTCQKMCENQRIRTACECFDEMKPETNLLLNNSKNLRPCRNEKDMQCLTRTEWNFQQNVDTCDCNSPCSEKKYEVVISSRQWPSPDYAEILVESICDDSNSTKCRLLNEKAEWLLREDFVKLNIFYEDLNYEQLEENASYELSQFLSDVGGTIGLWIGLSILGIFELLNLTVDIFLYFCCGRGRNNNISKRPPRQVYDTPN